jgi:hypothetical protein
MPPETYRYYCLDASGRLHDTQWFDAADDDDAVAHVREKHPDSKCEVWDGNRLVASVAPAHFKRKRSTKG